jgi:hypothetical protein
VVHITPARAALPMIRHDLHAERRQVRAKPDSGGGEYILPVAQTDSLDVRRAVKTEPRMTTFSQITFFFESK